ncbi:pyruvate, water dikinase regulatory protein [Thiorhodospira sibirica]|uniref:posphoenolpyruvate synthetase regulatory kinase/phosphorylase PpsR n=1 Tax=Thiorhodospira sibirica TaxID=154347 RepID=UPI00022C585F|nr:pyruvate, water dikinase regulatory protein [Thiorhodospira sibirica]
MSAALPSRSVFYLSDGTGITAETLGHTLLTRFDGVHFNISNLPFLNTPEKIDQVIVRINETARREGSKPLVFITLVDRALRDRLKHCHGEIFDFFEAFTGPLEQALGLSASQVAGRSHGIGDLHVYSQRIDALHFALHNDDGAAIRDYPQADIILMGVSRTGKTPTCLYLALQFGIAAANYPLADEDFDSKRLPAQLEPFRTKLFGLTIDAERLQQIRQERRPNSRYASTDQVNDEVSAAERLFRRERIPFLNVTQMSVEEISAQIIQQAAVVRRIY